MDAPLRALLFDLDGTLYDAAGVRQGMRVRLATHVARRPIQGLRTLRFVAAYRRAQESLRQSRTPITDTAQLEAACRATGMDVTWAASVIARWMDQAPLDLVRRHMRAGLVTCLETARARGLRLGLFSDYPADAKLTSMGIRDLFDAVCWAQQSGIGAFKPDPRGLLRTLDMLGVTPAEALYVGDRPDVDGEAARRAGMRALIIGSGHAPVSADWVAVRTFADLLERVTRATDA
jgi:HAD superfamily hydrolase (TIGR01509 family)